MALSKFLNDEQICALLLVSDADEDKDDISDEEFIPHDSSSECCDTDDDITEDISAAASITAADTTHLQSSSGEHWYLNEPALQSQKKSLNILTAKSGVPAYAKNRIKENPCSAFDLILDKIMMKTILIETNNNKGSGSAKIGNSSQKMNFELMLDCVFFVECIVVEIKL